jgi:two-component system phosphate regulon sensor histidine kinase PhoR
VSANAAQVAFTAEFVLFLIAVAGAALGALRGELLVSGPRRRLALVAGFVALGVSALVHGSLLEPDPTALAVLAPRVLGLVALAWAVIGTEVTSSSRLTLWGGVAALVGAEVVEVVARRGSTGVDLARIAGSVAIGSTLLAASRRSIAARVAAGAAATVLVVVLAVSITLSGVLVANVREEVLRRTDARAAAEVDGLSRRSDEARTSAASVATLLEENQQAPAVLLRLARGDAAAQQQAAASLQAALAKVGRTLLTRGTTLAYITAGHAPVPGTGDLTAGQLNQLPFLEAVEEALTGVAGGSPDVLGSSVLAVAANPVRVQGDITGAVVVAVAVDDAFLRNRSQDDRDLSLAAVTHDGVLARAGAQPPEAALRQLAARVLAEDEDVEQGVGGRFVAAHAIRSGARPLAVLVASAPSRLADETRDSLFRTLFLVALAGTLVAIVLASVLGGRIGGGLRRLTDAAGEIQLGNLEARVGLDQPDELGVLGTAFERMAVSLRTMTDELREAAIDEARLRARLEAIVAGMGEALVAVDANGSVVEFNAAAEQLFGRAASSVRGRPVTRLRIAGLGGADLTGRVADPGPGPWSGEAVVESRREQVPVVVTAAPLRGPTGEPAGAVALFRDMRRDREVERMKTEFLSNISHEMRTPLTPIKGYSRMLSERDVPTERTREFAGEIAAGAAQLERVIDQLVNFATMAAGRLEPEPVPVAPRELLDDVVARWADRASEGHQLERRVARGTPTLQVDQHLVSLSLDELVDNALKYSPSGGRILLQARPGEGGTVELSVSDRGVGVEPARLESIFDDFTQADASATRRFGGLGLGLPMVRHVARAHGGDVVVDSHPGKGTTFTMTLPAVPERVGR